MGLFTSEMYAGSAIDIGSECEVLLPNYLTYAKTRCVTRNGKIG